MNDPHNPSLPEDSSILDDVDDFASGFVDGLVTVDDLPDSIRSSVLARAAVFDRQRQSLLRTDREFALERRQASDGQRDDVDQNDIDRAIAAYRRQQRQRLPRSIGLVAAAASFLILSGLVIAQVGSDDSPNIMTEAADMALALSPAEESNATDSNRMSSAQTESAVDDSALATYDGAQTLESDDLTASALDSEIIDIQSIAELQDFSESASMNLLAEQSVQDKSNQLCVTDETLRLITRRARFQGTLVEIYQSPTNGLRVYSQIDCRLIAQLGS